MQKKTDLIIRRFQDEDAKQVSKVIQRTMLESNSQDYPMTILQPLHDYFTPEKVAVLATERHCLVAIIENKIVGTGALEEDELKTIFVSPSYQGKGIGRQIVHELEKIAKQIGISSLKVPTSITGMHFYEKMGYLRGATFESKHAGQQTWMQKTNIH